MSEPALRKSPFAGVTWSASTRVSLYGLRLSLRVDDAANLDTLARHLPHGSTPTPRRRPDRVYSVVTRGTPESPRFQLHVGPRRVGKPGPLQQVARRLDSNSRQFVAANARTRVFIHAGVVAVGDRAIVIPGRTMTGKTTLVAALMKAGATYYSDEYAVLDEAGLVYPFAKPLSIRNPEGGPQSLTDASSLGGTPGTTPLRIGAVLATRYQAGVTWSPEPQSSGQAMLQLLDNAVAGRTQFAEVCSAITASLGGAPTMWSGVRGEAAETAQAILAGLARESSAGSRP